MAESLKGAIRRAACGTLLGLALGVSAAADARTAASCSFDDVSAAVAAANRGDTVMVPPGEVVWPSTLTITKGLTLRGSGIDVTIIHGGVTVTGDDDCIVFYRPDAIATATDEPFRVTGFTFNGNWNSSGVYVVHGDTVNVITKVRIDGNKFVDIGNVSYSMRAVGIQGLVYGLVDNNRFIDCYKSVDVYGKDWYSWNFPVSLGTVNSLYIESNTFVHTDARVVSAITSGGLGGRYVFRYNSISNPFDYDILDVHGNLQPVTSQYSPNGSRGVPCVEIYENTVVSDRGSHRLLHLRGGTGIVYDNSVTQTRSTDTCIGLIEEDGVMGFVSGPPGYDTIKDTYIWNNRVNGTLIVPILWDQYTPSYIRLGIEYYLEDPRLHGYTPLIYPHPMTQMAALGSPRGLRVKP
jgi:hypothetical protein